LIHFYKSKMLNRDGTFLNLVLLWSFLNFNQVFCAINVNGEKCEGGRRQSPIDIDTKTVRYQEFRPFKLRNHDQLSIRKGSLYATNTGHTLKLKAKSDHTSAIIAGGPLNVDYEFVEMHFHWGDSSDNSKLGSEHRIDGKSYPLELHMVHRNVHDETVEEALQHENGITVLGFKFQVVPDSVKVPAFDTLMNITSKYLRKPKSQFEKLAKGKEFTGDVNVLNFLPVLVDEYFHYDGSLTTGGCQEAVNWVVFKVPLAINQRHLQAFMEMENEKGENIVNNFRETQPVNDRPVYYHGIDLINQNRIQRGSSTGLRTKGLPKYEDFLLTHPCPLSSSPAPGVMAEIEDEKSSQSLWKSKTCAETMEGERSYKNSNILFQPSIQVIWLAALAMMMVNQGTQV